MKLLEINLEIILIVVIVCTVLYMFMQYSCGCEDKWPAPYTLDRFKLGDILNAPKRKINEMRSRATRSVAWWKSKLSKSSPQIKFVKLCQKMFCPQKQDLVQKLIAIDIKLAKNIIASINKQAIMLRATLRLECDAPTTYLTVEVIPVVGERLGKFLQYIDAETQIMIAATNKLMKEMDITINDAQLNSPIDIYNKMRKTWVVWAEAPSDAGGLQYRTLLAAEVPAVPPSTLDEPPPTPTIFNPDYERDEMMARDLAYETTAAENRAQQVQFNKSSY